MTNPDLGNAVNGSAAQVAPLAQFRHKNEFGEMVESFRPMPTVKGEVKYYYSSHSHCKLHRWDGTPLPFVEHFFETDIIASQAYLQTVIDETDGQYIKEATVDQVEMYKMRKDPRGTITQQVREQVTREVEADLEQRLREKITEELIASVASQEALAGVDGISAALRAASVQKVQGATIMMAGKPVLQGIVSSDNTAGNAAGSTSTPGGVAAALAALKK